MSLLDIRPFIQFDAQLNELYKAELAKMLYSKINELFRKNTTQALKSKSQNDVWYVAFNGDYVTEATIDRVYHCTDELALEGESFRRKNTMGDS